MDHHPSRLRSGEPRRSFWLSRAFLVFLGFASIAVVLLWQEHKVHLLGLLPYLLLLACPLMHILMHGRHGHGGHGRHARPDRDGDQA